MPEYRSVSTLQSIMKWFFNIPKVMKIEYDSDKGQTCRKAGTQSRGSKVRKHDDSLATVKCVLNLPFYVTGFLYGSKNRGATRPTKKT